MPRQIKNSKKAHEFIGLCLGVLADQKLVKAELEFLRDWLRRQPGVAASYPVKGLFIRLCEVLENGLIDGDAEKELFRRLYELTGSKAQLPTASPAKRTPPVVVPHFTEPVPLIKFTDKHFYLHGQFIIGTSEWLFSHVIDKGGLVDEELDEGTDYCIIGAMSETMPSVLCELVNKLSNYGKNKLKVISEENWVDFLFQ